MVKLDDAATGAIYGPATRIAHGTHSTSFARTASAVDGRPPPVIAIPSGSVPS
jgi:hypothetical protein